jgi:hypothetical protein
MICDFCWRDVDYVRASFWHGERMMCRECFAQWCDPDNVHIGPGDAASIGSYVRLQHGLPPLAAALTVLLLTGTLTARDSSLPRPGRSSEKLADADARGGRMLG